MTDLNNLKAEFGGAYLRAVAHAAGFYVQDASRMMDADGVDFTLFQRGSRGQMRSPKLDVQLKTTAGEPGEDHLVIDLSVKNHEELRATNYQIPRVLVVVVVPEDPAEWLDASEDQLVLRRCGYWCSLRGEPETENTTTQRVRIPRTQLFHVEPLRALMTSVAEGAL